MSRIDDLSNVERLPRIDKVLQEALGMVNQIDFDFNELALKAAMDQILSTRLLKLANSARYGGCRRIVALNEAIVRVGSESTRALIRASVLSRVFPHVENISIKDYWAETFEVSMLAGELALFVGQDPDEVFTTGTLHNMGLLMIYANAPEEAAAIAQRVDNGEKSIKVQREILGIDAPALGAKLAETWGFPERMIDAIQHVHSPSRSQVAPNLTHLLRLALDIHEVWDFLMDSQKGRYIARHKSAQYLGLEPSVSLSIDKFRGNGYELAYEMFTD